MAAHDSDDEDTFVTIGTALEPLEQDESLPKPVALQDQRVLDSRGRQRFHGAFTGGFSAGYFNTVGSKEGFTPSTFVSSRSKDGEKTQAKKPEDFMDEEDLGEHGIAPRTVRTTDLLGSSSDDRKRKFIQDGGIIPGQAPLAEFLIPTQVSIGIKLLRKMGWKDGQGVGARVQKKIKTKQDQKTYGCARPPESGSEDSDDDFTQGLMFAPKDMSAVNFEPKNNTCGIGYSGINPSLALGPGASGGHINLFGAPEEHVSLTEETFKTGSNKRRDRKGISGKAFGVGALNADEDDDDIYAMDSMSNYDQTTEIRDYDTHGWTAPKFRGSSQKAITHVGQALEGFTLSTKPLHPKKVFRPPVIPRGFKPFHVMKDESEAIVETFNKGQGHGQGREPHNSRSRATVLGEKPVIKSIFDLISKEDKDRMEKAKNQVPPASEKKQVPPSPEKKQVPPSSTKPEDLPGFKPFSLPRQGHAMKMNSPISDQAEQPIKSPLTPAPSASNSSKMNYNLGNFKPFSKDPAKQKRYEHYLEVTKAGRLYNIDDTASGHMTEWERQREKEEFHRSALLYRPLSNLMASRFTSAKHSDDVDMVEVPAETAGEKTDQQKAVEMKMFGKLTRDMCEWHPDKRLAKRFNVPNPYPDSDVVGILKVKKEKFSVFNFLTIPAELQNQEVKEKSEKEELKAITSGDAVVSKATADKSSTAVYSQLATEDGAIRAESATQQKEDSAAHRPSMDIFKAIFDDSSESESSSEEEEDEKSEHVAMDTVEPISEYSSQKEPEKAADHPIKTVNSASEAVAQIPPTQPVETRLAESAVDSRDGRNAEEMLFGPALPPSTSATSGAERYLEYHGTKAFSKESSSKSKEKKKERHKHKHKHKSKKKKHHKHKKSKHKKSGKSKKSRRNSPTSSESDWESCSSSEDDKNGRCTPTDRELLQKLKSVPAQKRPTAADFW